MKNLLPKEAAAFTGAKGRIPLYAFIKGNDYWLYSITSREYCDILCENEKELEYLKTIGIEFKKDKFVSHNK